jgi:hypothetical protein
VEKDLAFEKLRETLAEDFQPVKPLAEGWKRALWLVPLIFAFMEITLAIFHLRPDAERFPPAILFGLPLLQLCICYLLFSLSLESGIPGSLLSPAAAGALAILALGLFLLNSWITLRMDPASSSALEEPPAAYACISAIGLYGLAALALGFLLVRAGLPLRAGTAGWMLGLGSGLAAETTWHLHCPITGWNHILLSHGGAIVVLMGLGTALGLIWGKRFQR